MTVHDDETMIRLLARLPPVSPNPVRAERVRIRCHRVMEQKARFDREVADAKRQVAGIRRRLVEPIVIGGAVLHDVLRWRGLL